MVISSSLSTHAAARMSESLVASSTSPIGKKSSAVSPLLASRSNSLINTTEARALPRDLSTMPGFSAVNFNKNHQVGILTLPNGVFSVVNVGGENYAYAGPDSTIINPDGKPSNMQIDWGNPALAGSVPSIKAKTIDTGPVNQRDGMTIIDLSDSEPASDITTAFLTDRTLNKDLATPIYPDAQVLFKASTLEDGTKTLALIDESGEPLVKLAGVKNVGIHSTWDDPEVDAQRSSAGGRYLQNTKDTYSWVTKCCRGQAEAAEESAPAKPSGVSDKLNWSPDRLPDDAQDTVRFVVDYQGGGKDIIDVRKLDNGDSVDYDVSRNLQFSRPTRFSEPDSTSAIFNYDGRKGENNVVLADGAKNPIATMVLTPEKWAEPIRQLSHVLHHTVGQAVPGLPQSNLGKLTNMALSTYTGLQIAKGANQAGAAIIKNTLNISPPSFLGSGKNAETATPKILDVGIPCSAIGRAAKMAAEASGNQAAASVIENAYMQLALPVGIAVAAVKLGAIDGWKQAGVGFLLPNIIAMAGQTLIDHLDKEGMSSEKLQFTQLGVRAVYGLISALAQWGTASDKTDSAKLFGGLLIQQVTNELQIAGRGAISREEGRFSRNEDLLTQQLGEHVSREDMPYLYRFTNGIAHNGTQIQQQLSAKAQSFKDYAGACCSSLGENLSAARASFMRGADSQ